MGEYHLFCWHPVLFSILSSAVFESNLGGRQSWLPLFVLFEIRVLAPRATLIVFEFGFQLSKFCQGRWWCGRTMYGSSPGPRHLVYQRRRLCRILLMTTKCRRVPLTVLWYHSLTVISGESCCTSVIWSCSVRSVWFLTKSRGLIRLPLLKENKAKFQWDYRTGLRRVTRI